MLPSKRLEARLAHIFDRSSREGALASYSSPSEYCCAPLRPACDGRLKKAAPNPEAAKTHSLRVRLTKAQARHLFGPSREEASGFTIATPCLAALMASAELLQSHSVSIFGCNAPTFRFAAMRERLPPMT
jgi:hypothetical protein